MADVTIQASKNKFYFISVDMILRDVEDNAILIGDKLICFM